MTVESEFPPSLGKVARRELAVNGITRYEQLVTLSRGDLLAIHGVGPKAVRILAQELTDRGLVSRSSPQPIPVRSWTRLRPRSDRVTSN
ncbi:MAG: hypothetical protein ABWY57_01560 [Mycetocola sp.]